MDLNHELINLSTDLAKIIGKNSVNAIFDKIKAARVTRDKEEAINKLQEIISDLINDKNDLIRISQAYEQQLISYKISDEDIEYITNSIVPLLETLLTNSAAETANMAKDALDIFKPVLSKETFNILQLLGFNFKQAIGEPLTLLVNKWITSKIPLSPGQVR